MSLLTELTEFSRKDAEAQRGEDAERFFSPRSFCIPRGCSNAIQSISASCTQPGMVLNRESERLERLAVFRGESWSEDIGIKNREEILTTNDTKSHERKQARIDKEHGSWDRVLLTEPRKSRV